MRVLDTFEIENATYTAALRACRRIAPDCLAAIKRAFECESDEKCRFALSAVIENSFIAEKNALPVCQDTGLAVVFVRLGQDVFLKGKLLTDAINDGIRRAYADGCFRASTCDPITRENAGDNLPAVIYTEIVAGDRVNLTIMPKGFGSENTSRIFMLDPTVGKEKIVESVIGAVAAAGSKPCPPVIVGVGIGGTFDRAALLSKKALLRRVGSVNERADLAELENEILSGINSLGIGAQGFGGDVSALAAFILAENTHIAGLPVAVNVQCHCSRHEEIEL